MTKAEKRMVADEMKARFKDGLERMRLLANLGDLMLERAPEQARTLASGQELAYTVSLCRSLIAHVEAWKPPGLEEESAS